MSYTHYLLSPEIIIAMRQASLMCTKMGVVINEDGGFEGLYVEALVNGIMRMIKVDENFEKTVQEMYANPLMTGNVTHKLISG